MADSRVQAGIHGTLQLPQEPRDGVIGEAGHRGRGGQGAPARGCGPCSEQDPPSPALPEEAGEEPRHQGEIGRAALQPGLPLPRPVLRDGTESCPRHPAPQHSVLPPWCLGTAQHPAPAASRGLGVSRPLAPQHPRTAHTLPHGTGLSPWHPWQTVCTHVVLLILEDGGIQGSLLLLLGGECHAAGEPPVGAMALGDSLCQGGPRGPRCDIPPHLLAASCSRSRRSSIFRCSWATAELRLCSPHIATAHARHHSPTALAQPLPWHHHGSLGPGSAPLPPPSPDQRVAGQDWAPKSLCGVGQGTGAAAACRAADMGHSAGSATARCGHGAPQNSLPWEGYRLLPGLGDQQVLHHLPLQGQRL